MARSKYGNVKVELDGKKFDSKREAAHYLTLKARLLAGEIADLEFQVPYKLAVNGVLICTYRADFKYREVATGEVVVTDVKGMRTPIYKLKRKLMKALLGIDIQEV